MDNNKLQEAKNLEERINNLEGHLRVIEGMRDEFKYCGVGFTETIEYYVESPEIAKLILDKAKEIRMVNLEKLRIELENL